MSAPYIEKRLIACRELEALRSEELGTPYYVQQVRDGIWDDVHPVTRHFPAFDAGSASRDDEVDALRAALEYARLSIRCAAGVDEDAGDDLATAEVLSFAGSALAVSFDRICAALEGAQ